MGIHLRGTLGWLAWLGVHLVFLVGFRNRVVVLVNWAWNYFTWDRGSRVILDDGALDDGQRPASDRRQLEPTGASEPATALRAAQTDRSDSPDGRRPPPTATAEPAGRRLSGATAP